MINEKGIKQKIYKEHIAVHPLKYSTIDKIETDAGICLTASELAWRYNESYDPDNKDSTIQWQWNKIDPITKVVDGKIKRFIEIHAKESVVIVTEEAIYLNKSVAGACYTRVDLAWRGLSLVATPMKPNKAERLLILLYNQTKNTQEIEIGERIAFVMLHELTPKSSKNKEKVKNESRESFIQKFDKFEERRKIYQYKNNHDEWNDIDDDYIIDYMKNSPESKYAYDVIKDEFKSGFLKNSLGFFVKNILPTAFFILGRIFIRYIPISNQDIIKSLEEIFTAAFGAMIGSIVIRIRLENPMNDIGRYFLKPKIKKQE